MLEYHFYRRSSWLGNSFIFRITYEVSSYNANNERPQAFDTGGTSRVAVPVGPMDVCSEQLDEI